MPMYCCIYSCKNFSGVSKDSAEKCVFFRKPQDNDRRDLWIKEIKKYQKIDQSFVICQNHFEPKYLRNQKHGIRLTKDAIPTLFDAKPLPIPLETISSKTVPKQIAYVDMKPTIQFITSTEHQQDFGHVPQTESHQQQSKACVRCIQQDVKIQMLQVKIQKLQNTCDQRRDTIDSLRKELNILKRPDPSMQERCPVCYDKFPAVDEHLCNGKTVVGCEYCDETFTSTSKLLSHLSTQHHDKRFYKCEFCPRRFPMLILMVFHEKCHPPDKSEVVCEFCDVKYVTKYQLNKHIEEMHSNAPTIQKLYECGTCGECYSTAQQLLNHRSTAHVKLGIFECFLCKLKLQSLKETRHHLMETHQRDIKCVVCNDMFTNLEIEMHKCTGLESLDCVYCEQTFKTTQTLLQHLNDCTAEKFIHKCNYCREYFFMKSLIDRHMMHHEGDKDFACDLCSKSFAKKELLSIHKRRHNAIADSICDECGKGPFTVENLRRHKKTHSDYDNECPQCGRKFQHTKGLNRHLKNVHHDRQHQVVCSICGAKVQSFRALYKHKLSHRRTEADRIHSCNLCPSKFFEARVLRKHVRRTHFATERMDCEYCQQSFKYKGDYTRHLRTHLGDELYVCPTCPKRFRYNLDLERHKAEHYMASKNVIDKMETE